MQTLRQAAGDHRIHNRGRDPKPAGRNQRGKPASFIRNRGAASNAHTSFIADKTHDVSQSGSVVGRNDISEARPLVNQRHSRGEA